MPPIDEDYDDESFKSSDKPGNKVPTDMVDRILDQEARENNDEGLLEDRPGKKINF